MDPAPFRMLQLLSFSDRRRKDKLVLERNNRIQNLKSKIPLARHFLEALGFVCTKTDRPSARGSSHEIAAIDYIGRGKGRRPWTIY